MKLKLTDVAEFETRTIPNTSNGSGYEVQKIRGWWSKEGKKLLGKNREEAEDVYAILNRIDDDVIEWR